MQLILARSSERVELKKNSSGQWDFPLPLFLLLLLAMNRLIQEQVREIAADALVGRYLVGDTTQFSCAVGDTICTYHCICPTKSI